MSKYSFSDYSIFDDAIKTTNDVSQKITEVKNKTKTCKEKLNNKSIFEGPICDSAVDALTNAENMIEKEISSFESIQSYLNTASNNYKNKDSSASSTYLRRTTSTRSNKTPTSSVTIPSDINQAGYTVTCYGKGGWYLGGGDTPTPIASDTNQESVYELWEADGCRYKNGIAVVNVDGEDCYLIATAPTLGEVGDNVDVTFENGDSIPCVIADSKNTSDYNYTEYGHAQGDSSVNIIEFEVNKDDYNSKGNPNTEDWNLEWDSSSDVTTVDNYGSVI